LALVRKERLLLVNGEATGLDLTGASIEEAHEGLRRARRLTLLVWRGIDRLDPGVLAALGRVEASSLVLLLGQSLTARGPLDMSALAPLCQRLHGLVLEGEVAPSSLARLRRCASLRALTLRGAQSPEVLEAVGSLRQLAHIDLSGALRAFGPGPEGLRPITGLDGLVTLDLADNGLTDTELGAIGRLGGLQRLGLSGNPITGETLGALAGLRRLAWLDLGRTGLSPRGLARVAALGGLGWLGLPDTTQAKALAAFRKARPRVKVFDSGALEKAPGESAEAVDDRAGRNVGYPKGATGEDRGTAPIGVRECDEVLALMRCYFSVVPPAARVSGEAAIRRIRDSFLAQRKTAGARAPAVLKATCSQVLGQLRQSLRSFTPASKCLRP
jgi:hypothetical protein